MYTCQNIMCLHIISGHVYQYRGHLMFKICAPRKIDFPIQVSTDWLYSQKYGGSPKMSHNSKTS